MRYLFNRIVAGMLVALSPVFVMAQTWIPTKAITFVDPVTSGSSNDLIARMLSEELPAKLGQPVILDNRPDSIDLVGAVSLARSSPDGHTIAVVSSDVYMAPILTPKAGGTNFDIIKNFSPIHTAGSAPMLIVDSPSINVKSPQELVAYLKKNDATSYGSPVTGSPMNIAGEMLKRSTGTQMNHVPYRGELPSATPAAASQRPTTDINAVLAMSEFRDKLRGMGVQITGGISGDAAKLARDTHARNQKVVKNLNITVECATS